MTTLSRTYNVFKMKSERPNVTIIIAHDGKVLSLISDVFSLTFNNDGLVSVIPPEQFSKLGEKPQEIANHLMTSLFQDFESAGYKPTEQEDGTWIVRGVMTSQEFIDYLTRIQTNLYSEQAPSQALH